MSNTYASPGRCIYCSSSDGLAREHIIPHSLGGGFVFLGASCLRCADITKRFENTCARFIFGKLRMYLDLPSKRRKQRPKTIEFEVAHGGIKAKVNVPIKDAPAPLVWLPLLQRAGIVEDMEPSANIYQAGFYAFIKPQIGQAEVQRIFGTSEHTEFLEECFFQYGPFLRLLAKIAHGYAVAKLGIDAYKWILPPYILGQDDRLGHVVGGVPHSSGVNHPLFPAEFLKLAELRGNLNILAIGPVRSTNRAFMAVHVQLFRHMRTPMYEVIVAEIPR